MTPGSARGTVERSEPTKAERAAARRVAESKATIPHLYLAAEVQVPRARDDRPVAALVTAAASALRAVPRLNGAYRDGAAELYSRINIGVAMPGPAGVVVPTVFDADQKEEGEIAQELDRLGESAEAGSLTAAETAGGTFTIAAPGGAIDAYAPIIHGGQAANLGIGAISDRVLAGEEGTPIVAPALTATLAVDGRMIGTDAGGAFFDHLRAALGAPAPNG